MTEKLKSILGLVDEREEVYFLLLVALLTYGWLWRDALTGTEYAGATILMYSALIAGKKLGGAP